MIVGVAVGIGGAFALYNNAGVLTTGIRTFDTTTQLTKAGLSDMRTAPRKRVSSWGAGGLKVTGDGLAPATAAFDGTMGGGGTVDVGTSGGGSPWNGGIKNLAIWPTQLPDATLQAITT
jgi:hypothetical protein